MKIFKNLKSNQPPTSQRRIQSPVKIGDENFCENSQPVQVVNFSLKKLHPKRSTSLC